MTSRGREARPIIPVEIWDLPAGGKLLQERRDDADFADHLAAALAAWSAPHVFDRVHVVGGGATDAIVAAIAARWACTVEPDPFAAARGAAPCADVGQTSVKLADPHGRTWRVARDLGRAPLRDGVPLHEREAARTSTIAWLVDVLAPLRAEAREVTVGLPCEIVDGVPRSCTYCWRDPDPGLVAALGAAHVVNDAVLAARASRVPPGTLVVTIGFGVGGAIVAG
ncbi:MAG: hypothetical protein NT062_24115 [Proteobacteria bacterium]|nr:hypothetical protein [Pseudomonadota bacterium]